MEMDYNLKKLANYFKFFAFILGKLLKPDLQFVFHRTNQLVFSYRCSTNNFMLEKRFYVKFLSSFD